MAKAITPLSATQIKQARKQDRDYKLADGGGLYLLVTKAGGKYWKLKYKYDGKEKKESGVINSNLYKFKEKYSNKTG